MFSFVELDCPMAHSDTAYLYVLIVENLVGSVKLVP